MRTSKLVEWGIHLCVELAADDRPRSSDDLAAVFDLPRPYVQKCLQALARGDVLRARPGARGGYQLARPADEVTLAHVLVALNGPRPLLFECTEIRQQGTNGAGRPASAFRKPCGVTSAMRRAEDAWWRELARTSIGDLARAVPPRHSVPTA